MAMDDLYGGTNRYFRKVASKSGISTSFVDATNPANIEKALRPNTKMVGFSVLKILLGGAQFYFHY